MATEEPAWTSFFADPSETPEPEIAFSVPFFSAPEVLEGVISTTIFLSDIEALLVEFVDPDVVYFILDENNMLIATSLGEDTWIDSSDVLIAGSDSSNQLVSTTSSYIADNGINAENTFILQNDKLNLEDMIATVHKYTDALEILDWKLVSAQYYDEDAWNGDSNSESDETAEGVAIALGVILFVVVGVITLLFALGKVTYATKGEDNTNLTEKTDEKSDSKL